MNYRSTAHWIFAGTIALAAATALAQTPPKKKLYKWTDEKGQVHYSETMPTEAKDRQSTEIDRRGRVLRKNEAAMSKEEIEKVEASKEQRKQEEKRAEEQRRRDSALLNTYTTEAEIEGARERAIAGASNALQAIEGRWRAAKAKTETLKKNMDALQKAGKPVPEAMVDELGEEQRSLEKIGKDHAAKAAEIEHLKAKYDSDKLRFRELTAQKR